LSASVLIAAGCGSPKAAPAVPSQEVDVASVLQKDVPIFSEWVATLDGYINAQIQPQVAGYVIRQTYKEGSLVRKGQILFQIDPRPLRVVVHGQDGRKHHPDAVRARQRGHRSVVGLDVLVRQMVEQSNGSSAARVLRWG
jgi:multidrug efflux pump subunit AcrA (membrane-fusion protein)